MAGAAKRSCEFLIALFSRQRNSIVWWLSAISIGAILSMSLATNVRAADMPEISKEFVPGQVFEHGYTTVVFTITNDDTLTSWNWSFTDNLPSGVTVADPAAATIDCTNGDITAAPGSGTIQVSGDMEVGQADCTASVRVTSASAGAYENCEANFTDLVNIYAPADCAELTCEAYDGDLPDFFINCESAEAPEEFDFSIQESWSTDAITQAYQTPMVGDLYGTGEPVAVVAGNRNSSGNGGGISVFNRRAQDLHIIRTSDGTLLQTIETPFFAWSGHAVMAIADLDNDGQGEIVLKTWRGDANDPGVLIAYRNDGTVMWTSNERYDYGDSSGRGGASMGIADFNGDGNPEVYVGNQIFNGQTGTRLVAADTNASAGCPYRATYGCFWSQATAADMNNDGQLEIVAGDTIYEVNLTNLTGEAGNSLTVLQQADAGVDGVGDGYTAVADMNLDGFPDVIVSRTINAQGSATRLYVWDGQTGEVMGVLSGIGNGTGAPMIGDIDNDGAPEIVIQNGNLRAFDFDSVTGLSQKWSINTNDGSAQTSLAMFDFNNDGRQELVYRDETDLRIIDGSGATATNLATFPCISSTGNEMPVIADVDGSREARILVSCGVGNGHNNAALRAFEAAGDPWANTRPVWNQQAYFAAHVNNDLTIPSEQAPHWQAFEDPLQQCSDGVNRPMNSFQQQMTDLDPDTGCEVRCVPPLDYGDAPASYGTLRENDGARHLSPSYDQGSNTASLMLGQLVDTEREGFPGAAADGDDTDNINDEDGVADPIYFVAGSPTAVEVFVTNNTSQPATLAGWLDSNVNGTFEAGERAPLVTVPANTSDIYTVTFPAGTATTDTFARFRVFAGEVANPQPTGFVTGGEVEDYQALAGSVEFRKTVSPQDVTELVPGETFTYTITVENTGSAPLTGLSFTDDLSEVIDDATYQNDVTATIGTAVFNSPDEISWSGDLTPGQTATITYSVEVNSPLSGDGVMINGVVGNGPGSNCTDSPAIDPDCRTRLPLPDVSSEKTLVSPDSPGAGDVVTYRFTVTNNSDEPAPSIVVADDLTGVLDDAAYNNDASVDVGAVTYNAVMGRLNWIGDLAANGQPGDTATITYTVTVNDATSLGDGILQNALISTDCPNPPIFDPGNPNFDPSCATVDPVSAWLASKTIIPGNFEPGGTINYRVDIENVGAADLSGVSVTDNLVDVIDDATYNNDVAATAGSATFTPPESIHWNGDLAAGASATMTYSFTINDPENQSNHMVINTITGSPNCPSPAITDPEDPGFNADCVTFTPLQYENDTDDPGVPGGPLDGLLSETGRNILTYILIAGALVTTGLAVIFRKRLIALARR